MMAASPVSVQRGCYALPGRELCAYLLQLLPTSGMAQLFQPYTMRLQGLLLRQLLPASLLSVTGPAQE